MKSLYFFICMYMVVQLLLPIYKVCLCQLISGFGYIISSYFLLGKKIKEIGNFHIVIGHQINMYTTHFLL